VVLTILSVYFWGLGHHRSFFENSMMSTTVLAIAFFSFTTIGLYRGIKIRNDVGKMTDLYQSKFLRADYSSSTNTKSKTTNSSSSYEWLNFADATPDGDDILGIIVAIVVWLVVAIVLAFALAFIGDILIVSVLAFVGMLYWIFFRALRLVFKNSNRSKGDFLESMKWGLTYTFLYSGWIYGIFILVEFIKH
jgi:small-conductance mechanosensitive channel